MATSILFQDWQFAQKRELCASMLCSFNDWATTKSTYKQAKSLNGRGRPGPFYHLNDVSVYLCRQRGVRGPQSKGRILHMHSSFEPGAVHFSLRECSKLQCLGQKPQEKPPSSFFWSETLPPSVYTDVIHMIKWAGLPPPFCAYCKWSKTGLWEGLGTKLMHIASFLALNEANYA